MGKQNKEVIVHGVLIKELHRNRTERCCISVSISLNDVEDVHKVIYFVFTSRKEPRMTKSFRGIKLSKSVMYYFDLQKD